MKQDLYEVLGAPRGASKKDIKAAYKKMARQFHPDKMAPGADDTRFKEINHAYGILEDDEKREQYDKWGSVDGVPRGNEIIIDILKNFFSAGAFANAARASGAMFERPEKIGVDVHITLEEVLRGCSREIVFEREVLVDLNGATVPTHACLGIFGVCDACCGTGRMVRRSGNKFLVFEQVVECDKCAAKGWTILLSRYKIAKKKCKFRYNIKKGTLERAKILIEKIGHINPMNLENGGDVELNVVYLPHDVFKLDKDYNLIYTHTISVFESIVGGRISFEHISGTNIILNISGAIVPNTQRLIPNYGIPQGDSMTYIIVRFNVVYPDEELTESEKLMLRDTFAKYFSSNSPFVSYCDEDCIVFDS